MVNSRIRQFLFLIFLLTFSGCDTKDDFEVKNYFIKYYGEDGKQEGVDMVVNKQDGTMLLLGNTISPEDESQVLLVKTDSEGNILWQEKIGEPNETAVDIEPTLTGDGFVILSNVYTKKNTTTGLNQYDIKLSIVDSGGKVIQTMKAHLWDDQVGYSVAPISDRYTNGGYMITGSRSDTRSLPGTVDPPDLSDVIVLFYPADLSDTTWTKSIVNQRIGAGIKVFESETYEPMKNGDRPFYVFGYSDALTGTTQSSTEDAVYENNLWCVALNENGSSSADDFVGDPVRVEAMSETIKTNGSGFISVGTQTSSTTDEKSIVLVTSYAADLLGLRFTSQIIPVKESRNLEAVSITPSTAFDGRYLILSNEINATGNTNIWLSNVDIDGEVIWSSSFGSITKNDFGGTVRELPDGRIVILGTIELESQNSKMALIKLNSIGQLLN